MKKVSTNWKPFYLHIEKDSLHLLLPKINQIISSSCRVTRKAGFRVVPVVARYEESVYL